MALELEILLQSFGDDEPSGPDFEYEQEFANLMIAAQSKAEQQVGDQVIEAETADYSEVMKLATELLAKTKDLRIAVVLAEATLNRRGFAGFAVVVAYIRQVLEGYWDSVHPQLDADDDNDPTERLNAVLGLMGEEGVLQQLRRAPLTDGKMLGKYTLRHIAVTKGEMVVPGDMDETPDDATITAAFQETPPEIMAEIHAGVTSALQDAQGIEAFLDEKTPGNSPDFKPLLDLLKQAAHYTTPR